MHYYQIVKMKLPFIDWFVI